MNVQLAQIPMKERLNVKYVTIDMYEPYKTLIINWFTNAIIIIDSFHVIKHLTEALDKIRLRIAKEYDNGERMQKNDSFYYLLQKFHFFFTTPFHKLNDYYMIGRTFKRKWSKQEILNEILSIDEDLREAFMLKEEYAQFNREAAYDDCDGDYNRIMNKFLASKHPEYVEFGKLLKHWKKEIKNSFIRIDGKRLSNGPIEGINNKIKKILKNGNGFENFDRFRSRCLFSINTNYTKKKKK